MTPTSGEKMSAIKITFNKPLAKKILSSFARAFIGAFIGVFVAGVSGLLAAIYGSTTGSAGGTLDWSAGKATLVALVLAAIAAAGAASLRTLQYYFMDGSVFKLVSVKGLNAQFTELLTEVLKTLPLKAVVKLDPVATDTAPVTPQTEEQAVEQILSDMVVPQIAKAIGEVEQWHGLASQKPKDKS
jgi:hypothetical protein